MFTRPYHDLTGPELIRRLTVTAELLHEVGDMYTPYYLSEWGGVDRLTKYRELADECDAIMAECDQREIDWYEAYWGEPRGMSPVPDR